jgi:hypothetical protein
MKGTIQPDHIGRNKYELLVIGLPPIVFTSITGMEDEIQTTDLPDRTRATGGNRGMGEIVAQHPVHHQLEEAALEIWFRESQDPVLPTYKKIGALTLKSLSGNTLRIYTLLGMFPRKRKLPDVEMSNEGELAVNEWTFSVDDILPVA